jgi:hypothetical protein
MHSDLAEIDEDVLTFDIPNDALERRDSYRRASNNHCILHPVV